MFVRTACLLSSVLLLGCVEPPATPEWENDWMVATHHAEYAIQAAMLPAPTEPDNPLGPCETCGGDGVLGDGRIEIPCPDCDARASQEMAGPKPGATEPEQPTHNRVRVPRLLIFAASWCPACENLKRSIEELPETWTRGPTQENVVQIVDVSTVELEHRAKEFYAVKFESVPAVFAYWSKEKHQRLTEPADSAIAMTKWFNRVVTERREADQRVQPLLAQFLSELHRVTDTQKPTTAIDVDVSDKTMDVPRILSQLAQGDYTPSAGVTLKSASGLFPTRTTRQPGGSTRFHFDQRPTLTAKKWMLRVTAQVQWVDVSADGHTALVSLSGFPDIRLKL